MPDAKSRRCRSRPTVPRVFLFNFFRRVFQIPTSIFTRFVQFLLEFLYIFQDSWIPTGFSWSFSLGSYIISFQNVLQRFRGILFGVLLRFAPISTGVFLMIVLSQMLSRSFCWNFSRDSSWRLSAITSGVLGTSPVEMLQDSQSRDF